MGSYPRQDFVYGFYSETTPDGEEVISSEDDGENVYDLDTFCYKNGLEYASDAQDGVAVGLSPDWDKITGEFYLGGYYVSKFDVAKFNKWYEESKIKLTEEMCSKIKKTLHIRKNTKPALWTISNYW